MKVYCGKCKTEREIMNNEEVYVSKSYRIIKGRCSVCGSEVYKILEKKKK